VSGVRVSERDNIGTRLFAVRRELTAVKGALKERLSALGSGLLCQPTAGVDPDT
jgi:hypothetical protein